jgi:predicted O-methyltransferase YrrM
MKPFDRLVRNHWREYGLCLLLKQRRLSLPPLALNAWFPEADDVPVSVSVLPKGEWAAPLSDVVYLMKLVRLVQPARAIELGSYRGYVARAMAENMPEGAALVTVDIAPEHGEAYRGSELASRIERRVGAIDATLFEGEHGSYDFVFLDADHRYDAVRHDSDVVLPLLKPNGVIVWHDYSNWGAFSGGNGVPDHLGELAQRLPIAHLFGTRMAVHSPAWSTSERPRFEEMVAVTQRWIDQGREHGHWTTPIPSAQ